MNMLLIDKIKKYKNIYIYLHNVKGFQSIHQSRRESINLLEIIIRIRP